MNVASCYSTHTQARSTRINFRRPNRLLNWRRRLRTTVSDEFDSISHCDRGTSPGQPAVKLSWPIVPRRKHDRDRLRHRRLPARRKIQRRLRQPDAPYRVNSSAYLGRMVSAWCSSPRLAGGSASTIGLLTSWANDPSQLAVIHPAIDRTHRRPKTTADRCDNR